MTPPVLYAAPPVTLNLYPHQADFLERCRAEFRRGVKRIVASAPTGAGKSEIAAKMHDLTSIDGDKPSLFVVHRKGLVEQFCKRLRKYGVPHGRIEAGFTYDLTQKIQVASLDTLQARYFGPEAKGDRSILPDFALIVYDEAHTRFSASKQLFDAYPRARVIGLTATPALTSGAGMGEAYDTIVEAATVSWLTANRYLVPARYFAPEQYDVAKVKVGATGEYLESSLESAVDKPELIGNLLEHYLRLGESRPFVCFATSVAHSKHIADSFNLAGIPTHHVDANTPADEREEAYEAIATGGLRGLTNYGILDRGFDVPAISCCILARPVRHITTHRQMIGRVLRTCEGKQDAFVIDHAGNVLRHGFADDKIEWSLEPTANVNEREREKREALPERQVTCPKCKQVTKPVKACPNPVCGYEFPKREVEAEPVEYEDGNLAELDKTALQAAKKQDAASKAEFFAMLLYEVDSRRPRAAGTAKNVNWAAGLFKSKHGHWPHKKFGVEPVKSSGAVIGYVSHSLIKYSKRPDRRRLEPGYSNAAD